jgi:nitrogen fixation NifU-like protein
MDGSEVRDAQLCTRGCAISVASGSMLAELLPRMSIEQIEKMMEVFRSMLQGAAPPEGLDLGDLEALHGVSKFPVRVKCALLPWMTLKEALRAYLERREAPSEVTSTEESFG